MLNMGISSPSRFKRVSVVTALGRRNVTGAVFFTHIIRIEQPKGRKNRNVRLSPKMLDLLRQWWKVRPTRWDTGVPLEERWLFPGRKPGKPMTTRQLARLFRSKMLAMLLEAHDASQPTFFNTHAGLADKRTFKRFIAPLRRIRWVVYCKAPFARPEQVLRYLTPTASPSRTAASSQPTTARLRSAGRTIASTARAGGRRCGFTRTSSSDVS